ncbi:unnamed protein product [Paramecium sonneborni]|uniref:Uncharacterized protein n=1 Tax=Paramecium sonneborni TaxID=65129 RepID=A0A8S1N8H7_9CILI|nr:unnamed protein product [Paramecium sonneborni]
MDIRFGFKQISRTNILKRSLQYRKIYILKEITFNLERICKKLEYQNSNDSPKIVEDLNQNSKFPNKTIINLNFQKALYKEIKLFLLNIQLYKFMNVLIFVKEFQQSMINYQIQQHSKLYQLIIKFNVIQPMMIHRRYQKLKGKRIQYVNFMMLFLCILICLI